MSKRKNIFILGGDGYLGWSLGLAFANRTEENVILVDNLITRKWEKEEGIKLLFPLPLPKDRINAYKNIFGKNNLIFEQINLLNYGLVYKLIKKYRPHTIINAAAQQSAPFSMISPRHAAITFSTNTIINLNVLWAIAEIDKKIKYLKLGSIGCYLNIETNFVPLTPVDFSFLYHHKPFQVLKSWLPMQASDFYHQSKIDDFLITDLCSQMWKLKAITIQQSEIFGATIEENYPIENHSLSTRFSYDQIFGNLINRFVCQLAINHPLTIYGNGNQHMHIISLTDTVNNFLKIYQMQIKQGNHLVEHNYTIKSSIEEIAKMLADLVPGSSINYLKNPRIEKKSRLNKIFEQSLLVQRTSAKTLQNFKDELVRLLWFTTLYKKNIDEKIIMPTVQWKK